MLQYWGQAAELVMNFGTLGLIFGGVMLGIIIGAIPGLTATMGVALVLPLTFVMTPVQGMSVLMGIYVGGITGGLVSAVLLRMPGTPSSVATTFDGFPMAQRGEAGKALGTGVIASIFGTVIGNVFLVLVAPQLANMAVKFGPYEYFSLGVFSLTIISVVAKGNMVKGLLAALLGMALGAVGLSQVDGTARFTFGNPALIIGFNSMPVLIGLFAMSQILQDIENVNVRFKVETVIKGFYPTWEEVKANFWNCIRSCSIGIGIGMLPGIGGALANILAWTTAKKASKHPEKFGTGIIDGVFASESSNNAAIGGAMIPMMTLGIPGDGVTAMLLGGLMIHGLQPGPLLFQNNPDVVYGVFLALFIAAVFTFVQMRGFMGLFVAVLRVPKTILLPLILTFCVVGAYSANSRMFDVWTLLGFGILGYLLEKAKYPLVAVILGFILGPMVEVNLRRGLMASGGSMVPFFTRPISGLFLAIAVLSLIGPPLLRLVQRPRTPSSRAA